MDIWSEIKKKKELMHLSDDYVKSEVERISKKNNFSTKLSGKDRKELIKLVRAELRLKISRFRPFILNKDIDFRDNNQVINLLKKHSSTSERIEFYPELKNKIRELNPSTILDVGCGINPLALGSLSKKYYAYDLDKQALKIVSEYFRANKINGHVHEQDILQLDSFPKADLVLMFKILDVIEKKGHKKAENLILKFNSKSLIISFSTKTLSGAPMNHPQRGWIERLLERLGYNFKTLKSNNEIFYFAFK